jgi:hypothetical protein
MGTLKVWLKNSRCEQTISWPIGAKWANQWESHTLSSYLSYLDCIPHTRRRCRGPGLRDHDGISERDLRVWKE